MFRKALALYAGAFVVVAVVAKAAIVGIGLPDWVFPGSLIVMATWSARRAVDGLRAARRAARDHDDAHVHTGRFPVDGARDDGDDGAQGGAEDDLVPDGARRHVRVRRVHRARRRVHDDARDSASDRSGR